MDTAPKGPKKTLLTMCFEYKKYFLIQRREIKNKMQKEYLSVGRIVCTEYLLDEFPFEVLNSKLKSDSIVPITKYLKKIQKIQKIQKNKKKIQKIHKIQKNPKNQVLMFECVAPRK